MRRRSAALPLILAAVGCAPDAIGPDVPDAFVPAEPDATKPHADARLSLFRAIPECAAAAGGAEIAIVGSGFQPGATMAIAGAAVADARVVSGARIVGHLPPIDGASGPVAVTVTNPDGRSVTSRTLFSTSAPATRFALYRPPAFGVPAPEQIAIADLNGDRARDLAISTKSGVAILLGDGHGKFGPAVSYPANSGSIAIADMNLDGILDVVLGPDADVLLGRGDGSLQTPIQNHGYGDKAVVVDVNRDRRPDVVLLRHRNQVIFHQGVLVHCSLAVLVGNGDGTLTESGSYELGTMTETCDVAAGDFDGDGNPDLAGLAGASIIAVLHGNGDGTFVWSMNFRVSGSAAAIAAADLNHDGRDDIVVSDGYPGNTVSVLLAAGNGSFAPSVSYIAGLSPYRAVPGDVDGDGRTDLVVLDVGDVGVFLGRGDGSFEAVNTWGAGDDPGDVAVGDLDGDGRADVAVANPSDNQVSILGANRDGSLRGTPQAAPVERRERGPEQVVAADLDDDGVPDLIVGSGYSPPNLSVMLGRGDGRFGPARAYDVGVLGYGYHGEIAVGDLDGDGRLDVVAASSYSDQALVLRGKGDGTLQSPRAFTIPDQAGAIALADMNGDGRLDLLVGGSGRGFGLASMSLLPGDGAGGFAAPVTSRFFSTQQGGRGVRVVAPLDANNDDIPDVAWLDWNSDVNVILGNGDGSFQPTRVVLTGSRVPGTFDYDTPQWLVTADVDLDGTADLVVATDYGIAVELGNGDGTFRPAAAPIALSHSFIAVADLNGDCRPDLAVIESDGIHSQYPTYAALKLLLGHGGGTFGAPIPHPPGGLEPRFLTTADLDRDGRIDLAIGVSETVSVILNVSQ